MRFAALDLIRYGPFSGVRLDFRSTGASLHVVYGENEAGKSTTLRALHGLLFGIPQRTGDAHRHAMKDLRVGATLVREDGQELSVVRRKGRKDTLLDPSGAAISDDLLAPFLSGVTGRLFESAFGLDHVSLRTGAEALLAGGGDVGESLFGASAGGAGIHRLRVTLAAEADALFTPRGRGRKLIVQQMARVVEQRGAVELASVGPEGYVNQKRALEEATVRREALRARHAALTAEQSRLLRTLQVLPHLGRRRALLDELGALGPLPDLPPDARDARLRAEAARDEGARESARLSDVLADLDERLRALDIPKALLELDEDVARDIEERLGRHQAAQADLPKVRAKLQAAEEDVDKAMRAVRPGLSRDGINELRPEAALVARVRSMAGRHGRLVAARDHAGREVSLREARLAAAREHFERMPAPRRMLEAGALSDALESDGELERRLGEVEKRRVALERRLGSAVSALGGSTTAELVRRLVPPLGETVDRYERGLSDVERRIRRLGDVEGELAGRRAEAERGLDALRRGGDVVTEEELAASRAERDASLQAAREVAGRGEAVASEVLERVAEETKTADGLADRMRREADRVARFGALVAERDAAASRIEVVARERAEAEGERAHLLDGWRAEWDGLPEAPKSPAEMRAWMQRFREAERLAEEVDDVLSTQRDLRGTIEARRAEIASALGRVGVEPGGSLREDLSRLRRALADEESRAQDRRAAEAELGRLEGEIDVERRALVESEEALRAWQGRWALCMSDLGLGATTEPEEALGVLDALSELFARVDTADNYQRRILGMVRDSDDLARDVRGLAERYLPGGGPEDFAEAARAIVRRYARAKQDQETFRELSERRSEAASEKAAAERSRRQAEARLEALCRAAGVSDPAALEIVERKMEVARGLERQLAEVERELVKVGAGATVPGLVEETRGVSFDDTKARLNEIESELADLVDEVDRAAGEVATRAQGVARLGGADAAQAALELGHRVASLEHLVRRYLELRLASAVLDREVERFRNEHQGPVLSRASEFFPRLTRGRYRGLSIGYSDDDRAALRCVLADGTDVGVEALSDGTRDQLYLALRLSTLEVHARHSEPMPFVLDDALVHFDDERAAEALRILGEVAEHCQVLFFTHHARLLEIAQAVVPKERLAVHRLPSGVPLSLEAS